MNAGRRKFIRLGGQALGCSALGGAAWRIIAGSDPDAEFTQPKGPYVWRINPEKCTFCGKCETACVRSPSAVKAVNDQVKCSYCVACYGHLADLGVASDRIMSEGKRVCPHDAVMRTEISGGKDGYHRYFIDPNLCTACGKCTQRCNKLGTASMFLIIRPDLCIGCNRCSIAAVCPENAIELVHCYPEDDYRGDYGLDQIMAANEMSGQNRGPDGMGGSQGEP